MRPESFDSGTRLQTLTLIGCSLLKNRAVWRATDFRSAKDGIIGFFSIPCQALGFLSFVAQSVRAQPALSSEGPRLYH